MAAKRYYYSDTITDFLQKEDMVVIGKLALAYSHDINDETKMSWLEELRVMRSVLKNYKIVVVYILNTIYREWEDVQM